MDKFADEQVNELIAFTCVQHLLRPLSQSVFLPFCHKESRLRTSELTSIRQVLPLYIPKSVSLILRLGIVHCGL